MPQNMRLSPPARRVQLELGNVNDEETAILFPLVRALLELRRSHGASFELLLNNTLLLSDRRQLDLAPIKKAIRESHKRAVNRPVEDKTTNEQ